LSAQFDFESAETDLAFYADVMVNAMEPAHREKAFAAFNEKFEEVLNQESSFDYQFEKLKWVSFTNSPDNSFRFISWQLSGMEDTFDFKSYFQNSSTLIELKNTIDFGRNVEFQEMSVDNWYGRLIYDIMPVDDYYLLFGFRQLDKFTKTKTVEILRVNGDKLTFGEPIFGTGESKYADKKSRLILTYSADASTTLNYNPGLEMIVFDHMIPQMGRIPGQGETQVPDGSYEAYKLEDGQWQHIEQLYTELIEKPKTGARKETRDIQGNLKKNN
jgi:hypothetical protein